MHSVRLTTVCLQHHKSKTLDPKWNEFKYCLVQEPKTQNLHVEVHDYDVVNFAVCPTIRHASTLLLPAEARCNPSAQDAEPARGGARL